MASAGDGFHFTSGSRSRVKLIVITPQFEFGQYRFQAASLNLRQSPASPTLGLPGTSVPFKPRAVLKQKVFVCLCLLTNVWRRMLRWAPGTRGSFYTCTRVAIPRYLPTQALVERSL
eukprot:3085137-Rhodomonas_salina.1